MPSDGNPKGNAGNPGSRILRERAMKILRETRAGIDPALLAAMKERFSAMVPDHLRDAAPIPPPAPSSPPVVKPVAKADAVAPEPHAGPEPVDKQKIAQIVLQYMKNREEKSKH